MYSVLFFTKNYTIYVYSIYLYILKKVDKN